MDFTRGKATVKTGWTLDKSKYTPHQLEFLQYLGFPSELKTNKALQKRLLLRKNPSGGYTDRETQNYKTLAYSAISKNTAKYLLNGELDDISLANRYPERKQKIRSNKYAKPYLIEIVGANPNQIGNRERVDAALSPAILNEAIEAELNYLFREIYEGEEKQVEPTPSLKKAIEAEPVEVIEDVKGLSNVHKKKARELAEGGASSGEIAAELKVDEKRVINYLKQL